MQVRPSPFATRLFEYHSPGLGGSQNWTNLSLVSSVGTRSKLVAYGHNRADYSFVAGGMVPGVLIIKPDFPEQKDDWPFLWFENEYTASTTSAYILAANAAIAATKEDKTVK